MTKSLLSLAVAGLSSLAAFPAMAAQDIDSAITLSLPGPGDIRPIQYQCEGLDELLDVTYVNAAPNFLALVTIEAQRHIFVATLAASGVRYVSDKYVWWSKGAQAALYDVSAGDDAAPLWDCLEHNNIP